MFKKALSVLLSVLVILGTVSIFASAKVSTDVDRHLQYGKDGKFRIMQIADIQDGFPMNPATKRYLNRVLDDKQVDLIVLTGDNISSGKISRSIARKSIDQFMSIFESYGVPVAAVFGNHDDENTPADKAFQLSVYESYSCFVGCAGEDFGEGNLGTYYVPIYSSTDKNDMVSNIWMIDSGTYNTENDLGGYACTTKAQIEWYKNTSAALEQQYGKKIPSLMFQHIIVPNIWDYLVPCEAGTPNSVVTDSANNRALTLPEGAKGKIREIPCPPNYSNGQLEATNERGDVLAMFFGHDHTNSFEITLRGTDIVNTPGVGFNSYNSDEVGVRLITLDEKNPWSYETELYTYLEMFEGDELAMALFHVVSSTATTTDQILGVFKIILLTLRVVLKSLETIAK